MQIYIKSLDSTKKLLVFLIKNKRHLQSADCQKYNQRMNHIFLIGMMGAGKSTVGSALAKELTIPFIDTDEQIIHREGVSVSEIFRLKGEAYFRLLEQQIIAHLPEEPSVVACGGGLPCHGNQMAVLKQKGVVVYLEGSPELLYKRIEKDLQRPLLKDFKAFKALLEQRQTFYKQAHLCIGIDRQISDLIEALKVKLVAEGLV